MVTTDPDRPIDATSTPDPPSGPAAAGRRRGPLIALALGLLLVIAGVVVFLLTRGEGSPDGAGGGEDAQALVDRVLTFNPDTTAVTYIDLAAAREAQGLPADADPREFRPSDGPFHQTLLAFPHLITASAPGVGVDAEAIDTGQVSVAASARGQLPAMTVIRTTQPFEEIAEVYLAAGYERDGDAIVYRGDETLLRSYHYIAEQDGLIVLVQGRTGTAEGIDLAAASAEGEPSELGAPVADLVDGGALGVGLLQVRDDAPAGSDCVRAYGVAATFDTEDTADAVFLAAEGRAADVRPDPSVRLGDRYTFGEPQVDGDLVLQPITGDEDNGTFTVYAYYAELLLDDIWSCA